MKGEVETGSVKDSKPVPRPLAVSIALFVALVAAATPLTFYLMAVHEGRPVTWAQAFVFVLESVTTVGYGELLPFSSIWMNLLSALLMISGITVVFFLLATLVAEWVEERVSPRVPSSTDLERHVVLTDFNELVESFVKVLSGLDIPFLVIVSDDAEALRLRDEGINLILGDPDDPDTLDRANLGEAVGFVACGSDSENLGAVLAARSVSDSAILSLVERRKSSRYQVLAGANDAISPKEATGRALVDWTLAVPTPAEWPPPIKVEEGAEVIGELNPSVFYITEGSPLSDLTVEDVGESTEALVVGFWRGGELVLNPDPGERISGAALIALGEKDDVHDLAELASEGDGHGPVVIAGYGDVGAEAHERLKASGVDAAVIDLEDKGLQGQIVGDARSTEVLEEAKLDEAKNLVIAINDDNVTIQCALEARFLNPSIQISARALSGTSMSKYVWAGVDHPISMPSIGARMLLQSIVKLGAVDPPFDAVAARRDAGGLVGEELRNADVRRETGCLVVGIVRDGEVVPAHGKEALTEGDELLLGSSRQVERFDSYFSTP